MLAGLVGCTRRKREKAEKLEEIMGEKGRNCAGLRAKRTTMRGKTEQQKQSRSAGPRDQARKTTQTAPGTFRKGDDALEIMLADRLVAFLIF